MKRKSLITAILTVCMIAALCVPASAKSITYERVLTYETTSETIGADEFSVKFNGEAVTFPDAQPFVDSANRTLVPVRFVAEKMGADVQWDSATNTAIITKENTVVKVAIGKKELAVTKSGVAANITMDTEAVIKQERTFVPIRFVAVALGAWVSYSDLYNTAQIYDDVLSPENIARLHSHHDMTWEESCRAEGNTKLLEICTQTEHETDYPEVKYFAGTGTYGFENANEWILRAADPVRNYERVGDFCNPTFKGKLSGLTYKHGDPTVNFANIALEEVRQSVKAGIDKDTNFEGFLDTDLSCVFQSKDGSVLVRGVLVVLAVNNVSASYIKSTYGVDIPMNLEAGVAYLADFEKNVRVSWTGGTMECDPRDGFTVWLEDGN